MTLLFDGQNAFFAERGKTFVKALSLRIPENAALFLNDACHFPENGTVQLPLTALRHGTNALALRIGNRIFPTESLVFDGESLTPAGLSSEALLLRQNEMLSSLAEKITLLSRRVEKLEQKNTARMLFS